MTPDDFNHFPQFKESFTNIKPPKDDRVITELVCGSRYPGLINTVMDVQT